jgi:alcohol dehydrogenase, propanol-preferring
MCAGVTAYKAIKESEARPGEFCTIIGAAGGLGHLGIQYAKAMGLRVIAMDVGADKLAYCIQYGAEFVVDVTQPDAAQQVLNITGGGSHGVLCIAPSKSALTNSVGICRPRGTIVCVGLPPGAFECPVFDVVKKRITIRGSIVGTRKDLQEALYFASRGLVKCQTEVVALDDLQSVFDRLRKGQVHGRVVVDMTVGGTGAQKTM